MDDDEENIQKKPTNCSQTPHKNKIEATTKKDIADTLAETFSANSSINNSNSQFLTFKKHRETNSSINNSNSQFLTFKNNTEKQKLNFKSNSSEKYNQPFTPAALQEAIKTSHNTAVAPDEIHYEFLKNLPQNSLNYLLTIFNDIWINSKLPESWKIATIISIPKKNVHFS